MKKKGRLNGNLFELIFPLRFLCRFDEFYLGFNYFFYFATAILISCTATHKILNKSSSISTKVDIASRIFSRILLVHMHKKKCSQKTTLGIEHKFDYDNDFLIFSKLKLIIRKRIRKFVFLATSMNHHQLLLGLKDSISSTESLLVTSFLNKYVL